MSEELIVAIELVQLFAVGMGIIMGSFFHILVLIFRHRRSTAYGYWAR